MNSRYGIAINEAVANSGISRRRAKSYDEGTSSDSTSLVACGESTPISIVSTSEDELNSNYPAPVPFSGAPIFRSDDSNDGSLVIPVPIPAFGNVAPIEGCSGPFGHGDYPMNVGAHPSAFSWARSLVNQCETNNSNNPPQSTSDHTANRENSTLNQESHTSTATFEEDYTIESSVFDNSMLSQEEDTPRVARTPDRVYYESGMECVFESPSDSPSGSSYWSCTSAQGSPQCINSNEDSNTHPHSEINQSKNFDYSIDVNANTDFELDYANLPDLHEVSSFDSDFGQEIDQEDPRVKLEDFDYESPERFSPYQESSSNSSSDDDSESRSSFSSVANMNESEERKPTAQVILSETSGSSSSCESENTSDSEKSGPKGRSKNTVDLFVPESIVRKAANMLATSGLFQSSGERIISNILVSATEYTLQLTLFRMIMREMVLSKERQEDIADQSRSGIVFHVPRSIYKQEMSGYRIRELDIKNQNLEEPSESQPPAPSFQPSKSLSQSLSTLPDLPEHSPLSAIPSPPASPFALASLSSPYPENDEICETSELSERRADATNTDRESDPNSCIFHELELRPNSSETEACSPNRKRPFEGESNVTYTKVKLSDKYKAYMRLAMQPSSDDEEVESTLSSEPQSFTECVSRGKDIENCKLYRSSPESDRGSRGSPTTSMYFADTDTRDALP